jgi:hypothetical protein
LNPSKLAGQCGKLKCCLNYELDQYVEALRDIPSSNTRLQLAKGTAHHFKTDIFRRMMFFIVEGYEHDAPVALSVSAVHEIIALNKSGQKPEDISEFAYEEEVEEETTYSNVVGQDSLTRFDQKKRQKRKGGSGGKQQRPNQQGQLSANNLQIEARVPKDSSNVHRVVQDLHKAIDHNVRKVINRKEIVHKANVRNAHRSRIKVHNKAHVRSNRNPSSKAQPEQGPKPEGGDRAPRGDRPPQNRNNRRRGGNRNNDGGETKRRRTTNSTESMRRIFFLISLVFLS